MSHPKKVKLDNVDSHQDSPADSPQDSPVLTPSNVDELQVDFKDENGQDLHLSAAETYQMAVQEWASYIRSAVSAKYDPAQDEGKRSLAVSQAQDVHAMSKHLYEVALSKFDAEHESFEQKLMERVDNGKGKSRAILNDGVPLENSLAHANCMFDFGRLFCTDLMITTSYFLLPCGGC